jgi:hypothetical protein
MAGIAQIASPPGLNLTLDTNHVAIGLGENAIVELTVIGTNGFNDTVALSSSIAPNPPGTTGDGFSASFSQDVFRISPGQPSTHVNLTLNAYTLPPYPPAYPPLGSYTVSVFALGQNPPHYSASTQMQVTVQPYAPPQPKLLVELGYRGLAYPGAMIQLDTNFTDIGNVQLIVTGINFTGDFGSFKETVGFPLPMYPGEKGTTSLNLTIPPGIGLGEHKISLAGTWEYYIPNYYNSMSNNFYPGSWNSGDPIGVSGPLTVTQKTTSNPFTPIILFLSTFVQISGNVEAIIGLTVYACMATLASLLAIRNDRRKIRELAKTHPVFSPLASFS